MMGVYRFHRCSCNGNDRAGESYRLCRKKNNSGLDHLSKYEYSIIIHAFFFGGGASYYVFFFELAFDTGVLFLKKLCFAPRPTAVSQRLSRPILSLNLGLSLRIRYQVIPFNTAFRPSFLSYFARLFSLHSFQYFAFLEEVGTGWLKVGEWEDR